MAFSCIIGEDPSTLLCGTTSETCDGVVNVTSANLNSYYNYTHADTFYCKRSGSSQSSPLHTELPRQTDFMLKGLDESNEYNTSYEIDTSKTYFGNFTIQSKGSFYTVDYDDYIFNMYCDGKLNFSLFNIPVSQCYFRIKDTAYNTLFHDSTNGKSYIAFNKNLTKGKYYFEIYCKPDETSWYYPYAFKFSIQPIISIDGRIVTPKLNIVKNGVINIYKDSTASILSSNTGKYSFTLSKVGNYTLRPTKNNDITKANGVNSVDALLVQRHVLNTTKLNNAYKLIAADVDGNKAVNSVDVLRIKRLILGTDTTFKNTLTTENRLWAFVDSAYQFPDTTNPFPFKDSISFINLTSNKTNQTFIGVKLGDVNFDWNSAVAKPSTVNCLQSTANSQPLTENCVQLVVTNKATQSPSFGGVGEAVFSTLNSETLSALQTTIHFDNTQYEFVSIGNNKYNIDFNTTQANTTGNISLVWIDKQGETKTFKAGEELFSLVLSKRSTVSGQQFTDWQLNDDITPTAAFDEALNKKGITLRLQSAVNGNLSAVDGQQWTIYPNPAKDVVHIASFNDIKAIKLINAAGQVVIQQSVNGKYNYQLTINNYQLPKGLYIIQITTTKNEVYNNKLVVE